jgi:alkylation response protein AidB-like acyl-CoA dehydrogenase
VTVVAGVDDRNEFDVPLTPTQLDLLRQVRALGQERFAPRAGIYDAENRFPVENFEDLRRAGLLGLLIPAEHGGQGADFATYALVSAELGRHCGSTALAFNMHSCSMLWSGSVADDLPMDAATRARHDANRAGLYRLVLEEGALFAQPFSEPGTDLTSGHEAFGTLAHRVEGGWELTGRKHFASLAGHASHYGVLCSEETADGTPPSFRHTLYLAVPADAPGFSVTGSWDVMGMRATMSRDLVMEQVFVPAHLAVMPPGVYYQAARDWPHIFMTLSPTFLGIAEAALDFTVAYLQGEVEGGPRHGSPSLTKQLALSEIQMQVQGSPGPVPAGHRRGPPPAHPGGQDAGHDLPPHAVPGGQRRHRRGPAHLRRPGPVQAVPAGAHAPRQPGRGGDAALDG